MTITWPQLGLIVLVVAMFGVAAALFVGRRHPDWRAPIGLALKTATVLLVAIVVMAVVTALHKAPAAVTWTQLGAVVTVAALVLLLGGGGFHLVRKRPDWCDPLETALMIVLLVVLVGAVVAAALLRWLSG